MSVILNPKSYMHSPLAIPLFWGKEQGGTESPSQQPKAWVLRKRTKPRLGCMRWGYSEILLLLCPIYFSMICSLHSFQVEIFCLIHPQPGCSAGQTPGGEAAAPSAQNEGNFLGWQRRIYSPPFRNWGKKSPLRNREIGPLSPECPIPLLVCFLCSWQHFCFYLFVFLFH